MVHFNSREALQPDDIERDRFRRSRFEAWNNLPDAIEMNERNPDYGLISYNLDQGTVGSSKINVSINRIGEYLSRAHNSRTTVNDFMGSTVHPNISEPDLTGQSGLYYKLRDLAKSRGYNNLFSLDGYGAGNLGDNALAGVGCDNQDRQIYLEAKNAGKNVRDLAKSYGVDSEAARLYLTIHEFSHLLGIPGGAEGERNLEMFVNDYADSMMKDVNTGAKLSDKKRTELSRILRQVKRIAGIRYEMVDDIYGDSDRALYHSLRKEAKKKGHNTEQAIAEYVSTKLEYKGKAVKLAKTKKKQGNKKSATKTGKKSKSSGKK